MSPYLLGVSDKVLEFCSEFLDNLSNVLARDVTSEKLAGMAFVLG